MHRGYIRLWRKSVDSGIIQNPKLWAFWTWCLLKASHKHHKQMIGTQMIDISPGQFVFGRKSASEELNISEQSIRTYIKKLKNLKNLTIKSTNKFSIISIINWDIYQQCEDETNQQINHHLTSNQPATNHKQEHKNKRTKEINNTSCPEPEKSGPGPEQIIKLKETLFLEIPLIKKDGFFGVSETNVLEWEDAYPGINVRQEIRNLQQWNKANPERRKTRSGILKHIVSWLSKAQNRSFSGNNIQRFTKNNRLENNKQACLDFINGAPDA